MLWMNFVKFWEEVLLDKERYLCVCASMCVLL